MAHLQLDPASGRFRLRFRFGGIEYKRSIKTRDPRTAETTRSRVEETLRLLETGRIELPSGADPGRFILSDGKVAAKPAVACSLSVGELFRVYQETLPPGAKESTTLACERTHMRHLSRLIGTSGQAKSLGVADLQRYADARAREKYRKRPIRPETIRKELTTFRLVWNWAAERGRLTGPAPVKGVRLAKPDEKPPFMTWGEIEAVIACGGLTADDEKALWACLFLDVTQVTGLLDDVERSARRPFIYPMFVFAAHAGVRRSEILRSRIDDFDFENGVVRIREKKKSRKKAITYRHVDLTPRLTEAMRRWFAEHPGGSQTIVRASRDGRTGCPIPANEAVLHFRAAIDGSQWKHVKGFHVFRHSFASNAAAAGVDQRVIDEWMGHQTEEMRKRYRHLFPSQRRKAIAAVFG